MERPHGKGGEWGVGWVGVGHGRRLGVGEGCTVDDLSVKMQ